MELMFVLFNWAKNDTLQLIIKGEYLESQEEVWKSRMQATTDKVEQQLQFEVLKGLWTLESRR